MRARPSTAETLTGTSNTASRSAALWLGASDDSGASVLTSIGGAPPASRSGSGTLPSLSLIGYLHLTSGIGAPPSLLRFAAH